MKDVPALELEKLECWKILWYGLSEVHETGSGVEWPWEIE